jgi:hypothetical protein
MKRILLVGPMTSDSAGERNWAAPPLGVHRIAAYLRTKGHTVRVYDCNLERDFGEALNHQWDIIGFSPLQATLHDDILAMWDAKKWCPDALLVVGGIEANLNYAEIFDNSPVKVVVLGEGEVSIELMAAGIPPEDIKGTIVKHDASIHNDDKYWEWWNAIVFSRLGYQQYWREMRAKHPEDYDKEGGDTVRLVTSSHCNRGCTFCSVTQWHKFACGEITTPLTLTAHRVRALCMKVKRELPTCKSIYFVEDDFIQDRQRAMDFFRMIRENGPKFRFQVQTHTSRLLKDGWVDTELLDCMRAGGVEHITMGVENTCPHCLKSFNKVQRLDRVGHIIRECVERGIRPYILIILFPAVATWKCLHDNYENLMGYVKMGATISCEPSLMAYRGAPLYNSNHEMKYKVFDIDGKHKLRQPIAILPDDPDVREIQRAFNAMWPDFLESKKVKHGFKGATGILMLELLGQLLYKPRNEWPGKGDSWIWNGQIFKEM